MIAWNGLDELYKICLARSSVIIGLNTSFHMWKSNSLFVIVQLLNSFSSCFNIKSKDHGRLRLCAINCQIIFSSNSEIISSVQFMPRFWDKVHQFHFCSYFLINSMLQGRLVLDEIFWLLRLPESQVNKSLYFSICSSV